MILVTCGLSDRKEHILGIRQDRSKRRQREKTPMRVRRRYPSRTGIKEAANGKRSKLKISGSDSNQSSFRKPPENMPIQDTAIPQNPPNPFSCSPERVPETSERKKKQRFENSSNSGSEMADEGKDETDKSETLGSSRKKGFKVKMLNLSCRHKETMAAASSSSSGTKVVPDEKIQGTPTSRRKAMANREKRFTFVRCARRPAASRTLCLISSSGSDTANSCLNPVIYTVFNHDFRKAFKKILCRDTKGTFF
ncbi:hypothetical protein KUCAC02_035228 [Chaenocephalus aceratus]|nr:hypothetical protein KUCAC02_035228 [Chaenocephalus aceratus]